MKSNKIILGTVQFGLDYGINNCNGKPSDDMLFEILDLAYQNGIKYLDTAESYGDSQNRIGNYHKNSFNRFNVITKFSSEVKGFPEDIKDRILYNIDILKITSLYCYMYHSFKDFSIFFKSHENELVKLKSQKKIKKIGVSVYTNEELENVLECRSVDIIQLPFNLLDNDKLRGNVIRKAKNCGIEIHTRSVFLQGLFFKKQINMSSSYSKLNFYLKKINKIQKEHNLSIEELAIKYVLNKRYINNVLIGVESTKQLSDNLKVISKYNNIPHKKIDKILVKEKHLLNPSNWN